MKVSSIKCQEILFDGSRADKYGQADRQMDVPTDLTKLTLIFCEHEKRNYESGNVMTRLASTDTCGLLY